MNIIIGNIIALIASIIMVSIGLIKNKNKIIYIQTIQIGLLVLSNLVLGAITGSLINGISCIRNILCYKNKLNKKAKMLIILLSTTISILLNNQGIIGLLPLISLVIYTIYMDVKNVVKFKYILMLTLILWFIYDLYIMSFTSACFDLISTITTAIGIYQLKNKRRKKYEG